jgi:outer membrane receptor protein involved in Fe transport
VLDRLNLTDSRIKPTLSLDLSAGAELYRKEKRSLRLQADAENLNNRLNVLDFAGLFSASAIAPPRSYFLRLATTF